MGRPPSKNRKSQEVSPLVASAKARTTDLIKRLKAAMSTMEAEIQANEDLYPFNKGRITQAEVCRRAGINKVTLQNKVHKESTKVLVDEWVGRVAAGVYTGRRNVRRAVNERVLVSRQAENAVKTQYHIARVELGDARRRVRELEAEVEKLKSDNEALATMLKSGGQSKVFPLRRK